MESFGFLLDGFVTAATPLNLLLALIGVVVGTAVGVLPGIGPAMTVALLLPVTYGLEPTGALIMLAGIFYGGMYGGSTTSILLNTPGESSSVVTAIEGNLMAKAGKAAPALATAAVGSFVAGTIGTLLLAFFAPVVTRFAVSLGAPEYFAVMLLSFIAVTAVLGTSRLRGFISLAVGLTIGLVGIDSVSGQSRLTFGVPQLGDGIDVVVVAVGIFAVGEGLWVAAHLRRKAAEVVPVGRPGMSREDWKRSWKPWLRGTAFGFPFGAVPAGGAEIPTFLSYITEKRLSKHPEEFGKGAIEGVAGPEAANNASAAGTLVPMLSLGLPTNATAAVMLAALTSYGIQPGPLLLQRESGLVWALIASLFIGNLLLLVLNLPLAPVWARLLRLPRPYLYAGILFFASMGAYAVNGSSFDLILLLGLGLLGFGMRRFGIPVLPLIVGVILGPRVEQQGRRALQLSSGDAKGLLGGVDVATGEFVLSAIAITAYAIIVVVLLWPLIFALVRRVLPTRVEAAVGRLEEELHTDLDLDAPPGGTDDRVPEPSLSRSSGSPDAPTGLDTTDSPDSSTTSKKELR
ncbi:tripartite tricarboxylate transporter permease [Microlunatus flavus]|uniref:Putative tricarboxylic transport membrane protein n=1 Tax=Microlunatus flavus TaxID=1036181 RepID=A0A1H9AUL9_9ACTN|nr:tripartite tricarboxylate transporter permease [Microlunatus flavus]SEP80474.1 putative tricarboxylic transport membrane protein [Microlunatus flavus]